MKVNQQAIDKSLRDIRNKAKLLPREGSMEKKMQLLSLLTTQLIEMAIALRNQSSG